MGHQLMLPPIRCNAICWNTSSLQTYKRMRKTVWQIAWISTWTQLALWHLGTPIASLCALRRMASCGKTWRIWLTSRRQDRGLDTSTPWPAIHAWVGAEHSSTLSSNESISISQKSLAFISSSQRTIPLVGRAKWFELTKIKFIDHANLMTNYLFITFW